jgi:hypothetical protein
MKKNILFLAFLTILHFEAAEAALKANRRTDALLYTSEDNPVAVNNRVLALVNEKAITVIDVMKKMDMTFLKQFPEYASSPQARFQYYQINWRRILQELIDKELILADAAESKIPLSAGDVRQEMESLFGPNIIANLDKIDLTFDEAFKIIKGDLLLRRMMVVRVNSKVIRSITPQVIREAYEDFAKKNPRKETWHYQVVTVRGNDPTASAALAQKLYESLTHGDVPFHQLDDKVKEMGLDAITVSITDPYFHTESDVSDVIKNQIKELEPKTFSKPFAQKSRADKTTIFRIIFLKEKVPAGVIPYSEIENQIKDSLFEKAMSQESETYLKKLRKHHAIHETYIDDMVPSDFQPFSIK